MYLDIMTVSLLAWNSFIAYNVTVSLQNDFIIVLEFSLETHRIPPTLGREPWPPEWDRSQHLSPPLFVVLITGKRHKQFNQIEAKNIPIEIILHNFYYLPILSVCIDL